MAAIDRAWPLVTDSPSATTRPSWKSIHLEMQSWAAPPRLIDEKEYNETVLQLTPKSSEDDIDDRLTLEAQTLGLLPGQINASLGPLTSSVSTLTIASDSVKHSCHQSQSLAPTSCASSEDCPVTRASGVSQRSPTDSDLSSWHVSGGEVKRNSPLRRGFRKMAGFRRKKSADPAASLTLSSINSELCADTNNSETLSENIRSHSSVKSSKSSWSQPMSTSTSSYEHPLPISDEALKRSMECKELLDLQMAQLEQKDRFLQFQASLISHLRSERERIKSQRKIEHERNVVAQIERNDRAVEDFEARQLEEEMKMEKEHELERRTVMLRLRHMEAYCQNPTPPSTPVDFASRRPSTDSELPERKVTDRDYHSLAQQYRERDSMATLHASKINVLRGKQKKAVEKFVLKKEREVESRKEEQNKELAAVDRDFADQEDRLRLALAAKRARLERRWRFQALIERTKMEKSTGLRYAALPEIAIDDPPTTP